MKTGNMKHGLGYWSKKLMNTVSLGGLLALTILATGCGKSDSNTQAATIPGAYGGVYGGQYGSGYYGATNCATCSSYGVVASGIGRNQLGDELYLDVYGDPARLQQMQAYGATQYYGPAAAVGVLLTPTGLSYCGLPAGQYNLTSSQPGVWGQDGAGRSGQLILTATGANVPAFQIIVSPAQIMNSVTIQGRNGRQYQYTMATRMLINGDQRCEIDTN